MDKIPFAKQPAIIQRRQLNNHDFTIISSNCIAGMIYHNLGLRFDSPTINLAMSGKDYLKFVQHLHYYIDDTPLVENQQATDREYPVGRLGTGEQEIKINFIHYPDFQTAKEKWQKRAQRIHYDNLYFMMTDNDATPDDVRQFDQLPFEHKVVLTGVDYPDVKSAFKVPNCENNGRLGEWYKTNNGLGTLAFQAFNYVQFLNQK